MSRAISQNHKINEEENLLPSQWPTITISRGPDYAATVSRLIAASMSHRRTFEKMCFWSIQFISPQNGDETRRRQRRMVWMQQNDKNEDCEIRTRKKSSWIKLSLKWWLELCLNEENKERHTHTHTYTQNCSKNNKIKFL